MTHLAQWITYVTIKSSNPDMRIPREIVLKYPDKIVTHTCYAEELPEGCTLLGELDHDGNGLIVVPLSLCDAFYECDEAESIEQCMEEDQKLLSYAV